MELGLLRGQQHPLKYGIIKNIDFFFFFLNIQSKRKINVKNLPNLQGSQTIKNLSFIVFHKAHKVSNNKSQNGAIF